LVTWLRLARLEQVRRTPREQPLPVELKLKGWRLRHASARRSFTQLKIGLKK
jgi:hypothetical protein